MWRSYDYEFKQENHAAHEKRSCWVTTYPSHEKYYVPPPTMQKIGNNHPSFHNEPSDDDYVLPPTMQKIGNNHPSFHYEPSDDDDNDDHHYHDHTAAVNNNRPLMVHHDHGDRGNWYGTHHVHNQHDSDVKGKHHHCKILRPPSHQYRYPVDVDQQGKEASRINTSNRNRSMEDYYSRRYFPNYGEVSRLEDDYDNHEGIGEELDYNSLMKGMHGGNKVKKIEVIEYERRTYKGARQEWIVLSGSGASYLNKHAPWVKGF